MTDRRQEGRPAVANLLRVVVHQGPPQRSRFPPEFLGLRHFFRRLGRLKERVKQQFRFAHGDAGGDHLFE